MAYMSTEKAAKIRNALKAKFPEIKFSIRKEHHSSINVNIMESPYFEDGEENVPRSNNIIKQIEEIVREVGEYYNNSDAMIDYFDTAFYYHIEVGKWDKPHVKKVAKLKKGKVKQAA